MTASSATFVLLTLALVGSDVGSQPPAAEPSLPRYPGIKAQFTQSLSQGMTNEQRLALYQQTVAQGRYSGGPLATRMFGNFAPGTFTVSPGTPGLATTIQLLASDNRNVVLGNARTLRYAMSLQGDGRFHVVGLNRPRRGATGATDADIVFRHPPTHVQVRMEVKSMSLASQGANFSNLQSQIIKMAEDARRTGEVQVWANRQEVLPSVRAFAESHGVMVEERLRTGSTRLRPGDRRFGDFANHLDQALRAQARLTVGAGTVKAGMGIYLACLAGRDLQNDLGTFRGTRSDWLRLGEHGSTLLAGGGEWSAGAAMLARHVPALANEARLLTVTRWGGRLGSAGLVLAEGFLVSQYLHGDLTERQFWRWQSSLGGGLAGSAAGGFVGFKVGLLTGGAMGSLFGPAGTTLGAGLGGFIGTLGGGIGVGYAAVRFAGQSVDAYFWMKDADQQEAYAHFLLRYYQTK